MSIYNSIRLKYCGKALGILSTLLLLVASAQSKGDVTVKDFTNNSYRIRLIAKVEDAVMYYKFDTKHGIIYGLKAIPSQLQTHLSDQIVGKVQAVVLGGDTQRQVGYTFDPSTRISSAALFESKTTRIISPLDDYNSAAYSINNKGQIVGSFQINNNNHHAFYINNDGQYYDITKAFYSNGIIISAITDIADDGSMLGHGQYIDGTNYVVLILPEDVKYDAYSFQNVAQISTNIEYQVDSAKSYTANELYSSSLSGDRALPGGIDVNNLSNITDGENKYTYSVGAVPGGWESGRFNIPILTPPGFPRTTPHLSISVCGDDAFSHVGIGGQLNGLSIISMTSPRIASTNCLHSAQYTKEAELQIDGLRLIRLHDNVARPVGIPYSWESIVRDLQQSNKVWLTTEIHSKIRISCEGKYYGTNYAISGFTVWRPD